MTETNYLEREPLMMPTIVRRVAPNGGIQVLQRTIEEAPGVPGDDVGAGALCVFWSVEHAERDMYANGCYPEDGWAAVERDDTELELVFEVLAEMDGPTLAYVEPAPEAEHLGALLVRPEALIAFLQECKVESEEE